MEQKRPLNDLSETELLDLLKDTNPEEVVVSGDFEKHPVYHDLLQFFSHYNIKSGRSKVNITMLYRLYRGWSDDPLSKPTFSCKIKDFFKSTNTTVTINRSSTIITRSLYDLLVSKAKKFNRVKELKTRIENFITAHELKSGTTAVPTYILYHLYDKYCYNNGEKTTLSLRYFTELLRTYIKYSSHKMMFVVTEDFKKYISEESIQRLKEAWKQNEKKQKKQHKTPRT